MNENKSMAVEMVGNKEIRQKYIDRVEVLDKIKKLMLIPQLEMVTARQIADYYEVSLKTIETCYRDNKDEITVDGVVIVKAGEISKKFGSLFCKETNLQRVRGGITISLTDNVTLMIPNGGSRMFPKRAVLRFGMLLRDSKVAQEVRTQLLNIVEHTVAENPELLTAEIDDEKVMLDNILAAYVGGNPVEILQATSVYSAYLKRYATQLEEQNKTLKEDNDILAGNILKWNDRATASKACRIMARYLNLTEKDCWNKVYSCLKHKYSIDVFARRKESGKTMPYLDFIREDEWGCFLDTISAILQENGISPSTVFEEAERAKNEC